MTVVARRPCRTLTKTFCGVVFRGARRLQKLFFTMGGCRRHCAIMNFWLVEVLESALESRHDFTLGSVCGLLRHSAMNFTFGGVYLGTDFCVSASHGWCACDRRGLRPALWRMLRVWWPQSGQEFRSRRSPFLRRPEFSISQSSGLKNWIHDHASVYGGGHFTHPSYLTVTCSVLFRLTSTGF